MNCDWDKRSQILNKQRTYNFRLEICRFSYFIVFIFAYFFILLAINVKTLFIIPFDLHLKLNRVNTKLAFICPMSVSISIFHVRRLQNLLLLKASLFHSLLRFHISHCDRAPFAVQFLDSIVYIPILEKYNHLVIFSTWIDNYSNMSYHLDA